MLRNGLPWILSFLGVLVTTSVKIWVDRYTHIGSPFLLYFTTVLFCTCLGGWRQGLFSGFLSLVAADYFFIGNQSFEILRGMTTIDHIRILLFVIDCTAIVIVCEALRRSREKSRRTNRENQEKEKFLRQSEARFRSVYEANMMGLAFARINGTLIDANEYLLKMLGYSREELKRGDMTWEKITPPEFHARSEQALSELHAKGVLTPYEKEYYRKDGSRIPVLIGGSVLEPDLCVFFMLDLSERQKADRALTEAYGQMEERVEQRTTELQEVNFNLKKMIEAQEIAADATRQSQSFLDSVVENIPNMIFVKDAKDLRFVRFNRAGEKLLGYTREELLGKNDNDFFPPEQANFFTENDRRVLEGGVAVDIPEENIATKTGMRFLHTKKIPISDKEGVPQYLLGISEDITERKLAEQQKLHLLQAQAAREEAEKTAHRLAFLSDASAALSTSLDVDVMLTSFAQVLLAEMADWCIIDLVPEDGSTIPEFIALHRDPNKTALAQEWRRRSPISDRKPYGAGHVLRTGQAELAHQITSDQLKQAMPNEMKELLEKIGVASSIVVPIKSYGRSLGALSFVSSTPQRLYDEFDLSLAHDLAKRVSYAVENARLFNRAQEASRAKSAFLANMSHEIRTPLGAMIGFAELLTESQQATTDELKSAATIARNGRQLLHIVDEILDLSKVESERITIEKIPFSLKKLIQEVRSLLELKAQEKSLTLEIATAPDCPERIITDPTRLRQILINVIGNAIKFTESGDVRVDLRCSPQKGKPKHCLLEFTVTDSGIGINEQQERKLFQPFAQADESTTRRFGGTGLGLFLARKLARLLGGDLRLGQSHPGRGSQFIITIEGEISAEAPSQKARKAPEKTEEKKLNATNNLILVVDDAPDNRALLRHFLTRMGYRVDVAENGTIAVEKALNGEFDLVLMDIQMPGMDGFEALKSLRQKDYEQPIVALTAHAMKGDRERCLQEGFDDYLSKPIDKDRLQKVLNDHLHNPSKLF